MIENLFMAGIISTFIIAIVYANARYSQMTPKERDKTRDASRWW